MSTDEKTALRPTVISSVTLTPGSITTLPLSISTSVTEVSSTSSILTPPGAVVTSVVVRVDGDQAIRQANDALAGIEQLRRGNTLPRE